MNILISFILISFAFAVHGASTRKPDVAPVIEPKYQNTENNQATSVTLVGNSLSSPSDTKQFAPVLDGVVIEPVVIGEGNQNGQIKIEEDSDKYVPKDENQGNEVTTTEQGLVPNDNSMVTTTDENIIDPVVVPENQPNQGTTVINDNVNSGKENQDLPTPTTPIAISTPGTINNGDESGMTGDQFDSSAQTGQPCPDFNSRYEGGKFIVTLDDGKCEMVVSENVVPQNEMDRWARGRYSPVYQLLSREYKPEVTFRQTTLAPSDYSCKHRTRQNGNFFIVDTILGRCQMVIGIPTLPDLRYALSQSNPTYQRPVRPMPTWPRLPPSSSDDSED